MGIKTVYICNVCGKETKNKNEVGWYISKRQWFSMNPEDSYIVYCPEHNDTPDYDKAGGEILNQLIGRKIFKGFK